jgi:hypothetical protein
MSFYRVTIAAVMVVALALTLSWLQGRYDQSDHRKALELINSYKAMPNGPTIPELIQRRHPEVKDHEIHWSTELTSGCLGVVRATAYVPKKEGRGDAASYAFDIRLTDPSIHPTDPVTIEVLKALTVATATTATATSTAAAR